MGTLLGHCGDTGGDTAGTLAIQDTLDTDSNTLTQALALTMARCSALFYKQEHYEQDSRTLMEIHCRLKGVSRRWNPVVTVTRKKVYFYTAM